MKEIKDVEERIWKLIEEATQSRDSQRGRQLNTVAQDIDKIKQDIQRLQKTVEELENQTNKLSVVTNLSPGKSVTFPVTSGAIRQNYMVTTQARKAGLLPPLGQKLAITTSTGQKFVTDELPLYNRLRERGKIAKFYREAGIHNGGYIRWTKVGPNEFHIERV